MFKATTWREMDSLGADGAGERMVTTDAVFR
jgi:hypothetical protein